MRETCIAAWVSVVYAPLRAIYSSHGLVFMCIMLCPTASISHAVSDLKEGNIVTASPSLHIASNYKEGGWNIFPSFLPSFFSPWFFNTGFLCVIALALLELSL